MALHSVFFAVFDAQEGWMVESVQTRPERLKAIRYTVCSIERREGRQETCLEVKGACFTLKHRETWRVSNETSKLSADNMRPR